MAGRSFTGKGCQGMGLLGSKEGKMRHKEGLACNLVAMESLANLIGGTGLAI